MSRPAIGASPSRSSCATLVSSATAGDLGPHQDAISNSAPLNVGGSGPCGPLPTSPFQWDVDGAHTHALVSPVLLNGKKKGGLLSGLKKMFHHTKPDSMRAATGAGQGSSGDLSITSANGIGCGFDTSISGGVSGAGKGDRSLKSPPGLRVQVASSRDLTLAALLTSPVRAPGAPGSPAVINSPMPSMRLEHTTSAANLSLSMTDGEVIYGAGEQQQRLFPNMTLNRTGGAGSVAAGRPVPNHSPPPLATSLSAQLPAAKHWFAAQAQAQQHQHQHQSQHQYTQQPGTLQCPNQLPPPNHLGTGLHKSYSNVLPNTVTSAASSSNLSQCLARGDSMDDYLSSGSGTSGRIALPQISSPRTPPGQGQAQAQGQAQDNSHHSSVGGGGGGGSGGVSPCGPGRGGGGGTPPAAPAPPLVPELDPVVYEGEEEAAEEDDLPGNVLLGMNPAVPAAMRRRQWALEDYQVR
jgi:hypothetical protein